MRYLFLNTQACGENKELQNLKTKINFGAILQ